MSRPATSRSRMSILAATLIAVIAAVHLQQHIDFKSEVPTLGLLFLLNAAGGAGLAAALLSRDRQLRLLAALGAIPLAAGSLIAIAIALKRKPFRLHRANLAPPDRDRDPHRRRRDPRAHHARHTRAANTLRRRAAPGRCPVGARAARPTVYIIRCMRTRRDLTARLLRPTAAAWRRSCSTAPA